MEISIVKTTAPKAKPKTEGLGFGVFTDHMFVMDYHEGMGWHRPRIVPYAPIEVDPGAVVFHYAQAVFEGLKAYRTPDGRALLFRPEQNLRRLNRGNDRMCIPPIDEGFVLKALKELVALERAWIPAAPGTSLYIRPVIIATEPYLGPRAATSYKLLIILAPVGSYLAGLTPVNIYVEPNYVRTAPGGTGNVKAAGNYGGQFKAQQVAAQEGYAQVLWLDGAERKYVEEVGAMNVFFNLDGILVTPDLGDTVLPGITRDSVLTLLHSWKIPTCQRRLGIAELFEAAAAGKLIEAFGCGTAAVISPIGSLSWKDRSIQIGEGRVGSISRRLYDTLTGIQTGKLADQFGWVTEVNGQA